MDTNMFDGNYKIIGIKRCKYFKFQFINYMPIMKYDALV